MENLLKNLREYLSSNTKEKILSDWAETAQWDNIGVTATEYFSRQIFTCSDDKNEQYKKFSSEFNSSSFFLATI